MYKILKIKSWTLLFLLLLTLAQSNAYASGKQNMAAPSIHTITLLNSGYTSTPHKTEKHLLTVQNEDSLKKTRIKKRMQYIDKILEEIDRILYTEEKASTEVLQKIKRLLRELERLRRNRDL
jgi:hypothetical protein